MHIEHIPSQPLNNYKTAAIRIIFSVEDYNVKLTHNELIIINTFFESLQLDNFKNHVADLITFGDFMNLIDYSFRWVYKGSITTPPCETNVLYNIVSNIYPIS